MFPFQLRTHSLYNIGYWIVDVKRAEDLLQYWETRQTHMQGGAGRENAHFLTFSLSHPLVLTFSFWWVFQVYE